MPKIRVFCTYFYLREDGSMATKSEAIEAGVYQAGDHEVVRLKNTPWTDPSMDDQRLQRLDAILHAIKASGKLAAILEAEGHGRYAEPGFQREDQIKYAADLVISTVRLADVVGFDLERAVLDRQHQENAVGPQKDRQMKVTTDNRLLFERTGK